MDFNTWKQFYQWGFCTLEQLKQAVEQGMLTKAQYQEITGETYPEPNVQQSTPATTHTEINQTTNTDTQTVHKETPVVTNQTQPIKEENGSQEAHTETLNQPSVTQA